MHSKKYLALILFALFAIFTGTVIAQEQVNLVFTYWGSGQEKVVVEEATAQYMAQNPNINIELRQIQYSGYAEAILSMVASGDPPDIAYLTEGMAQELADENQLLDLTSYLENDPDAQYVEWCQYHINGRYIGDCIAAEMLVLYYNKDLFDAAGLPYPPSDPDEAWTYDEFLDVAKQLTKDRAGNNAHSAAFNANDIATYGFSFWYNTIGMEVISRSVGNGGIINEDATALQINTPEVIDGLEKFRDLIFVHHVSPLPSVTSTLPTTDVLLQTGQLAMAFDGHWKVLDYSRNPDMNWGLAVMPKLGEPATVIFGEPMSIFAATEHPDEVVAFYKYLRDPASVALYSQGLWMPVREDYYTDDEKITAWLEGIPGVYPEGAREALVDMANCCVSPPRSVMWVKDFNMIDATAIYPSMQPFWLNEISAQEAVEAATAAAAPLLQGRNE